MDQFDLEMESLEEQHENGDITSKEYSRLIQEVERDYRDAARESAQDAYDEELDRW